MPKNEKRTRNERFFFLLGIDPKFKFFDIFILVDFQFNAVRLFAKESVSASH